MRPVRLVVTLALLVFVAVGAASFELGAYFDLSNLDFAGERPVTATTLPGDSYLWGVAVTGRQELSDSLELDLAFGSDPILRNVGYTLLSYTDRFFRLRLGPFFGLLNSPGTILQSGLSTTVELFVPGIAVLTLRSDNSLSGRLVVAGDYIQEQSELSVGFFVANAIPRVYIRTKRYTWKTDAGEAVDSFSAYGLETDVFQKNIPYRVVLDFSYQDTSRAFVESTTTTHRYGALVLGTELSVELFDELTLQADLESSVYAFGRDALVGQTVADRFLFRLRTGLAYSF
ncbi:MAG: hypothetical protein ACOC2N_04220 [Spirochaetota bacterium]